MKKYSKPYVAVESFQLNAAIAGTCAENNLVVLGHYIASCTLDDEKGTQLPLNKFPFFGDRCDTHYLEDTESGFPCYQVFIDSGAIFKS